MESYLGTLLTVKGKGRGGNAELAYASFLCNPNTQKDVLKQARVLVRPVSHQPPPPRAPFVPSMVRSVPRDCPPGAPREGCSVLL